MSTAAGGAALEVALTKRLGPFTLDVAFAAGDERVVLFGPSGAGKTVTLRCVAGILRPDAGSIRIAGEPVFDAACGINMPARRRRVGYVPQSYGLFPHLTVAENVAYGLGGLGRAAARRRVAALLERLELAGLERRRPRELSGGQQQRVALARALVTEPRVLLLDEPFAALEAPLRARLRRDLLAVHCQFRLPTLFVTHDLAEAYFLAERFVVYDRGRILQVGSRDAVLRRPASARVAELVGTTNLFPVEVEPAADAGLVRLRTAAGALLARAPSAPLTGRALACVRPEAIAVEPAGALAGPANRLPARIVDETATGLAYTLACELTGAVPAGPLVLQAVVLPAAYDALGLDRVRECTLVIPPAALHLLPAPAS